MVISKVWEKRGNRHTDARINRLGGGWWWEEGLFGRRGEQHILNSVSDLTFSDQVTEGC